MFVYRLSVGGKEVKTSRRSIFIDCNMSNVCSCSPLWAVHDSVRQLLSGLFPLCGVSESYDCPCASVMRSAKHSRDKNVSFPSKTSKRHFFFLCFLHGDVDECNLLLHFIRIIKSRRRLESSWIHFLLQLHFVTSWWSCSLEGDAVQSKPVNVPLIEPTYQYFTV